MKNLTFKTTAFTVIVVSLTCWMAVKIDSNRVANAYSDGLYKGSITTLEYINGVDEPLLNSDDLTLLIQLDSLENSNNLLTVNKR